MRALTIAISVGLLVLAAQPMRASPVAVGGYDFAPYVEIDAAGKPAGLALDLIDLLNSVQTEWQFKFVLTSSARRFQDFEEGRFDIILFESLDWEWKAKGLPVDASKELVSDDEVYLAQAKPGRGQDYFNTLADKRLVGIIGYHYAYAGFESDPARLRQRFDITLVNSNEAIYGLILEDRVDVGITARSYLARHLRLHPADRARLLPSQKIDQTYSLRALVRRGAKPGTADIDRLLERLAADGRLGRLWREAGLRD